MGTDEFFHAEPLNLDPSGSSFDRSAEEAANFATVGAYPAHIMRAASYLDGPFLTSSIGTNGFRAPYHPRQFYHFWKLIMSFFFPASEGYTFQYDWSNPASQHTPRSSSLQSPTSLVVFHDRCNPFRRRRHPEPYRTSSRYPVVLIQIFSPLDFRSGLLRETAARQTLDHLEGSTSNTSHETLLIVCAMGKAWRAWQKDTSFTEEEMRRWGIGDGRPYGSNVASQGMRDSEWMEDISNEVSRDILSRMCEDIKCQFSSRELAHDMHNFTIR